MGGAMAVVVIRCKRYGHCVHSHALWEALLWMGAIISVAFVIGSFIVWRMSK